MPVVSSNSFDLNSHRASKRRSDIIGKPAARVSASSLLASPSLSASSRLGADPSKRDSMLSTDSSATSSSKGGRRSIENVEFEGDDAHHQAQSSASSGCGHEDSPAAKSATWKTQGENDAEAKVAEIYSTPRSSADHETHPQSNGNTIAEETANAADGDIKPLPEVPANTSPLDTPTAVEAVLGEPVEEVSEAPLQASSDSATDPELVPAPAIKSAILSPVQTAVVPPTPTAPEWAESATDSVSPNSSPVQTFRSLNATDGSPRKNESGTNGSPASPFGTLALPNGKGNGSNHLLGSAARRDSSTSIGSANSSTSTYRIRRKPVPSEAGGSERRGSHASGRLSLDSSSVQSPATQEAPLPNTNNDIKEEKKEDEDGKDDVRTIQHTRSPSGSDMIRLAQEAAQARMLEKNVNGSRSADQNSAYRPTKSSARPSTAVPSSTSGAQTSLGVGKQLHGSVSSRDLSTSNSLGLGAPPSTAAAGAAPPSASRTPSRATIKRPTTAPVGSAGQFRLASNATQKSMVEVEGQQFVLGKPEASKGTEPEITSPSIPNAVRFLQHQRVGSNGGDSVSTGKRDSLIDKRKSASIHDANRSVDTSSAKSSSLRASTAGAVATASAAGGWGLEQELKIVDKVRDQNGAGPKPRPMSMDKSRKAQDAAAFKAAHKNSMLMNIINEDESDEVKAAAREAGIPEGSYAIHPPSMLQLFESSQCLVYNQEGQEVMFGDLFKKRRTLVCFLRHWWCGFCQQFAMSIRNIDPLPLKKANLDFIIVGQGDWHVIKAYREVMQVPYAMYADPKRNVYRALGMTLRTNDANPVCARPDYASMSMTKGILVAIKKGLFDMPIRNPGDMKLLGGDFILGPGLQCSFTHRMTTADGHMDLPRILAQAGCDLSLKTPKPKLAVDEKDARAAMLAGGNQNRTRSLGRSRGKKNKPDPALLDGSFGSANGHTATSGNATGSTSSRFTRPSLWGRFPGRFSKSQVSLPTSGSMADLSTDFGPVRGLSAGPRSASAMRKISYDGRVRESFETQQTDIEFESRATSIDTRGGRPSDVSAPVGGISSLNKAQSMSELRKRFQMGSGGFRAKSRQEPTAAKLSLESHLAVPSNNLHHSASSKSLRSAAIANGNGRASGAATPTHQTVTSPKQTEAKVGAKSLSVFRNNVISRSNGTASPAPTGLGIAAAEEEARDGAVTPTTGDKTMVDDNDAKSSHVTAAPKSMAELAAPGSFLMDLDVYDSLSRQPSQKYTRPNGNKHTLNTIDSGFSPSQFSEGGFSQEAAEADSDTEPSMSATQSPARSQRTNASSNASPASGNNGPSASNSFYSFNTFRGKTNLEHLPEEADEEESVDDSRGDDSNQHDEEEESEEEENDEPIEFEDGRSGIF